MIPPYKLSCILLLLSLSVSLVNAQNNSPKDRLTVTVDFESAKAVCRLLSLKKVDTTELNRVAGLYGNNLLIQKVKGYSGAGGDVFKKTLKEFIETGAIQGEDPYNWKLVKLKLPAVNKLITYLSTNKQAFIDDVRKIIHAYTPATLFAETKACFLVGGGSLGFTIGNDPTFNVALQKIGNDVEGLKYLVAHELYHSLQDAGQKLRKKTVAEKPSYQVKASYYLIYNLWAEGIANFVGDFEKVKMPLEFSKNQQVLFRKNADRKVNNFQLFEAMLYRQVNDSTAKYSQIYDLGFSNTFDESSYYVGYEMAKKLNQYGGDAAIANLLLEDPILFSTKYIALYQAHPEDKTFQRFSSTIEKIVKELSTWKDKL